MKNRTLSLRALWSAALLFWVAALPLSARVHQSAQWADSQFATAGHLRDTLEKQPEKQRTRHEYQRAIDAYRRVYFGSPTSTKADPSAAAVADLMVEMGHQFHDRHILHSAIKQYEFLRKEYPGSRSRFEALLTIGQIYKNDLNDPDRANDTFREFLRRYPHNELADAAKMALAEPPSELRTRDKSPRQADDDAEDIQRNGPSAATQEKDNRQKQAAADNTGDSDAAQTDPSSTGQATSILGIHYRTKPDSAAVTVDLSREAKYDVQRLAHPDRIYFDLFDTKLSKELNGKSIEVNDALLKQVRTARFEPGRARIVLEVSPKAEFKVSVESHPDRLVIELKAKSAPPAMPAAELAENIAPASAPPAKSAHTTNAASLRKVVEADTDDDVGSKIESGKDSRDTKTKIASPGKSSASAIHGKHLQSHTLQESRVHEAIPTADGDRSLIRALGLKIGRIVIDPGHGGHDTGTIGPHGLLEKDLVLDVSKRLDKLLETRLGADVILTRSDDTFVPLEQRTAIANEEQADLFISVHANSSHDPDARGVETYYLNFTSSPDALEVAARENADSDNSIHQLQDLVKTIALKEKIEESQEFASDVQEALHSGLARKNPGIRDRGVKKAPFIVLIGAHMPSILAEISFVSNPGDERRLRTSAYRQRIAESLYQGVAKYINGLSGVKVASKVDKSEGQ